LPQAGHWAVGIRRRVGFLAEGFFSSLDLSLELHDLLVDFVQLVMHAIAPERKTESHGALRDMRE
jgi:hypothetical protein